MIKKQRILILGGGFAGVGCARRLESLLKSKAEITLVSEDNFLLFTPMLPQVASGMIETRHIVMPIRAVCDVVFYEGRIRNIDPYGKIVDLWGTREKRGASIPYDFLVIALGSQTNFFGLRDVERYAYAMKTLNDAVVLRNRIIDMLEQAENETDPILRSKLLTFVIVGGGFAGIETAGELMDFLLDARKYYPNIRRTDISVIVLEAMKHILPGFDPGLARFAFEKMTARGITIRLETAVTGFDGTTVSLKKIGGGVLDPIRTGTLVWTAGIRPANTIKRSMFKTEKGKVSVDECLRVLDFEGVFAIGDCAQIIDPATGRPFAPTAQIAEAQAKAVSANLHSLLQGKPMRPFAFSPKGQMAIIGKRAGIASFFGSNISGFWAWFLWRNVYLSKIPRWSNRIRVLLDWTIDLFFDRDISRMKILRKPAEREYRGLDEVDDVW